MSTLICKCGIPLTETARMGSASFVCPSCGAVTRSTAADSPATSDPRTAATSTLRGLGWLLVMLALDAIAAIVLGTILGMTIAAFAGDDYKIRFATPILLSVAIFADLGRRHVREWKRSGASESAAPPGDLAR